MPPRRRGGKVSSTASAKTTKRRSVEMDEPQEEEPTARRVSSTQMAAGLSVTFEEATADESTIEAVDQSLGEREDMATTKASKTRWTIQMEETLVEMWELHPCLYDLSHPQYKDYSVRLQARQKIAAKLNVTG